MSQRHCIGAETGPIWALGTMSGTSMDGVDAALIETDGVDIFAFGAHAYRPYTADERRVVAAAMGAWPGAPGVAPASEVVEVAHVEAMSGLSADIVGFHGQTLAHDPGGRGTHQVGDGEILAEALDCPVAWDFRSADVALGGQGAPLAPFFHHAALRWAGLVEPTVVLNLGGVANITWLDPSAPVETCIAFDTGPANGPIDDLIFARTGQSYDEAGQIALSGKPDLGIVEDVLRDVYFAKIPPKSLDRADFSDLPARLAALSTSDAAATLVQLVADSVAVGLQHLPQQPTRVLVGGGGRHNPAIMQALASATSARVEPVETVGLDGDMMEAHAFGYLAVRVARGLTTSAPGTTGVAAAVGGGTLSFPSGMT